MCIRDRCDVRLARFFVGDGKNMTSGRYGLGAVDVVALSRQKYLQFAAQVS